ncbi:hypothetical protein DITRI_Ditri10aG0026300 [Diplodiscus trichospermus]
MAKIALVFVFSFALILSIQSVVGDNALSPDALSPGAAPSPGQTNGVTSGFKDAAESVKETASSLTGWAKDKLRGFGLLSPKESMSPASPPGKAPAPAHVRPFGLGPAAAP